MNLISEDYLMHHGVKGMKWGVRHDPNTKKQKRIAKLEKYQSKLINKSDKYAGNYRKDAQEYKNEINDMNRMGFKSAYWKQHTYNQSKQYAREAKEEMSRMNIGDREAKSLGTLSGSFKYISTINNKQAFDTPISELKESKSNSIRLAKIYTTNKKALMNIPITETTKKKDLKKVYRKNLKLFE